MSWSGEVTVGGSGQGGHSGHGIKWTDCRCVHREGAGLDGANYNICNSQVLSLSRWPCCVLRGKMKDSLGKMSSKNLRK